MKKPSPPGTTNPPIPNGAVNADAELQAAITATLGDVPPGFGVPQPPPPNFGAMVAPEQAEHTIAVLPLRDSRVLCSTCKYGHLVAVAIGTMNTKPDGTYYTQDVGFCLKHNPPLPLTDVFRPVTCSQYEPVSTGDDNG